MKEKLDSLKAQMESEGNAAAEKLSQFAPTNAVKGVRMMAGIFLICILFSVISKNSIGTLSTILFVMVLLWYLVMKDFLGEDEKAATGLKRWLKINVGLYGAALGLIPYCWLTKHIGTGAGLLGIACFIMGAGLAIVLAVSETGTKALEWMDDNIRLPMAGEAGNEPKPGDVVLCDSLEKIENGAKDCREILLSKDRFLHMLILGPTGCGKTSQIILPMCYQDVHNVESGLTVLEPKGDLAREVAMMAKEMGRPYLYFDPSVDNCPFFNPLVGDEADVIENAVTTFLALSPDSPQYFKDLSEQLVRYTLKVLKRLDRDKGIDGYYSTFIWMSRVLQNNGGQGRELVQRFSKIPGATEDEGKENADIASWFLNEYFAEKSKVYENSSGIRAQVTKVISNRYLRHILNPDVEKGEYNQLDFDKHLAEGGVICISTAQGLLDALGKFLGYFLILQFKSAVFRRPGNEDTRRPHWLYIDEFQEYSTPGFAQMLTQGRSYRVACHLATQARAQMAMGGGRDGKNFVELVSTNARNVVIFPGISKDDAKFYSEQFGEEEKTEVMKGITRKKFNPLTGGFSPLGHPSEQIREQTKLAAKYTSTDIIYRPFGEIIYCIIKKNSIQRPAAGRVKWLDMEYDTQLKKMIEEEIVSHEVGRDEPVAKTPEIITVDEGEGGLNDIEAPPASPPATDAPAAVPPTIPPEPAVATPESLEYELESDMHPQELADMHKPGYDPYADDGSFGFEDDEEEKRDEPAEDIVFDTDDLI